MKILFDFSLLLILISLFGCGTGRDFTINTSSDLKISSTTVSDIEDLIGKPEEIKTIFENSVDSKIYIYFYIKKPGYFSYLSMRNLELEIMNNSLNGYIYQSSFKEPNTDFIDSLRDEIIIGVSNSDEVLNVFGEPSGKIKLPTNLINYSLGINSVQIVPDAKEAWVYSLKYYDDVYNTPKSYYKFLIFFLDKNKKVVDKYYISNITKQAIKLKVSEH